MVKVYPVILCGGIGIRLWPCSTHLRPKQFLKLFNKYTLLQNTLLRLNEKERFHNPIIVGNRDHADIIRSEAEPLIRNNYTLILEADNNDTAQAAALGALRAILCDPEAVILIMPSDHHITDLQKFYNAIELGCEWAVKQKISVFGIKPTYPESGYGYIKRGHRLSDQTFEVEQFIEKPKAQVAEQYIESGGYSWNSGMFLVKASVYLQELEKFNPVIYNRCTDSLNQVQQINGCLKQSIDYAIMEKTTNTCVIESDMGWSDIGSWHSVWQHSDKDPSNNVALGDVTVSQSNNCYLYASSGRSISCIGLENLIVVQSQDMTLIASQDKAQEVKKLSHRGTKKDSLAEWGYYKILLDDIGYRVKHIAVKPGYLLYFQSCSLEAKHWTVVKGVATVKHGKREFELMPNESINVREVHELYNNGTEELRVIETQVGECLRETDIISYSSCRSLAS